MSRQLAEAQELLYASDTWSILLIFQAMDAAGKDGTIKHVMSGVNPQGCQVYSFKHPSAEELDHTFLWRCMKALPERGRIGIFNRSYYEEVLIVKVHPELVAAQRIPDGQATKAFWDARYEDINHFEQHLARNGTADPEVLPERLEGRAAASGSWPASTTRPSTGSSPPADVAEREYWDDYMAAYEACLTNTSTPWAPWHIVPADHKWVSRAIVAKTITTAIQKLDLKYPEVTAESSSRLTSAAANWRRKSANGPRG